MPSRDRQSRSSQRIVAVADIVAAMPTEMKSNNAKFCEELEKIVNDMMK